MSIFYLILLSILTIYVTLGKVSLLTHKENVARELIEAINDEYSVIKNQEALFTYYYNVDINEENLERMIAAIVDSSRFLARVRSQLSEFDWKDFRNQTLKALFHKMTNIGSAILNEDKYLSYINKLVELKKKYLEATVCRYNDCHNCQVKLPEILNVFATSRDPSELLYYWVVWRNVTGLAFADELRLIYGINNEIASLLGHPNAAEMWTADYATPNFEETIMKLWTEIKPLYDQLHAYVRRKLRIFYGSRLISENGTIPAHLLGNLWAQKWEIYDLVIPFSTQDFPNMTTLLLQKKYTIQRMAKDAEEFFQSLSFPKLNEKFWEKSILERRQNKTMSCQASAWDLFTGKDFRLKMCLKVSGADFVTLHHNLAHVHYFMEYKKQPIAFRDEPNPGFHEAIADLFSLTFFNSRYLKKLGLQKNYSVDNKTSINYLFQLALEKIVVLPYSIVLDLHRWNIFRRRYDINKFNCEWWKLREELQGISPPVKRGGNNYDPASKFHVIANKPYISYFVSTLQQFQLFKSVCIMADEYDPETSKNSSKGLHNCDFSGNKEVGEVLKYVMSMGSSVPWQRIMQMVASENTLSAKPLLQFFQPLMNYLQETNKKNREFIGWTKTNNLC